MGANMGCSNSKKMSHESESANSGDSTPPKSSTPSALDERLPLTQKQKFLLLKSWKGVARQISQCGKTMLIRLFKDDPQLMAVFNQKFRHLRERDADVLYQDAILDAHAATVMEALHEAITHLDDSVFVMKVLHDVGKMHQRYNVDPSVFLKVEKPFLTAVSEVLGDRYTKNMEEIYTITIKFILATLSEGATMELTEDEQKNLGRLWRPPGRVHKFVRPEKVAAIVDAQSEENGVH
ncbi:cytoglobin-1-like [Branchiostoma floridae]|uniref:Globin n=1 Tax=Branchiostoma floridae TaxID=7739 RepID=C3Y097_BRAFL|nr:cytoglobin-1-like [Branchiostoma floridae]CBL51563.1 globin [Branchiostoma floridae]|eukprot:XP_002610160.1 hypothetical protein BRAFLDRAFT_77082 [Branchiostoma floridae]